MHYQGSQVSCQIRGLINIVHKVITANQLKRPCCDSRHARPDSRRTFRKCLSLDLLSHFHFRRSHIEQVPLRNEQHKSNPSPTCISCINPSMVTQVLSFAYSQSHSQFRLGARGSHHPNNTQIHRQCSDTVQVRVKPFTVAFAVLKNCNEYPHVLSHVTTDNTCSVTCIEVLKQTDADFC